MALRVLLADESSTIKKVMMLALQDFGVEVKAVPVGIDVLSVAQSYQPDIIFADVLLAKRNGYDVCYDIKSNPELSHIPVVLMWSGFMEFDEARAQVIKADGRLEKPFDTETLRSLATSLVTKLKANEISSFLQFPPMPEFSEEEAAAQSKPPVQATRGARPANPAAPSAPAAPFKSNLRNSQIGSPLEHLPSQEEEPEQFQSVPLKNAASRAARSSFANEGMTSSQISQKKSQQKAEEWTQAELRSVRLENDDEALQKFIDFNSTELDEGRIAVGSDNQSLSEVSLDDLDEVEMYAEESANAYEASRIARSRDFTSPTKASAPVKASAGDETPAAGFSTLSQIDSDKLETIMRQEIRQVLENMAWKVLPDIAEKIIREELRKLLKDVEKL